jgi:S-adenosylmethionine-dependent methyltransferase
MDCNDRNFDDIADQFADRIGNSLKGRLRREVVMQDLRMFVPDFDAVPRRVLDAGGGYGQMSVLMAAAGHDVTYCDLSAVMTEKARGAAREAGCEPAIQFFTGPCQTLRSETGFDLVMSHAMLEWTADPRAALAALTRQVVPGGWLSLLVYNAWSHEFNLLRLGDLQPVLSGDLLANQFRLTPTHPIDPDALSAWLVEEGFQDIERSGVRVFCDYMQKDRRKRHEDDALADLELSYSRREPFWRFGRYVHVLARRAK